MPVKIAAVEPGSLAEELGWRPGDHVLAVNGEAVEDELDFRFKTAEEVLELKVRRQGALEVQHVEKDYDEGLGVTLEEFRIKTCGDDCVFCFVDQNPLGLRDTLYFRDGDFRLSFLYGNYVTVTNLRERDLARIVEQRLSPLYVSVHCTDDAIRRAMMGHRTQRDRQAEKLRFFHDHGIEMHAQIVLVPGFNDGGALVRTILDLYALHERLFSVSVVPVGLTRHRRELTALRTVSPAEAQQLVRLARRWQAYFREKIGRGFVYLSDEMYLLAGEDFPQEGEYDGYPLMENGVGMCRDFLNELAFQAEDLPEALEEPRRLTLATGTLAAPLLAERVAPVLERVAGMAVDVVPCENRLFGDSVTVSGLLNYRSFFQALAPLRDAGRLGDLVLLPPDSVNFEGKFLDEAPGKATPADLAAALGVPVEVFGGDWVETVDRLADTPAVPAAA
jgi:putative radical SAM enzyme (TIGR03279 family)